MKLKVIYISAFFVLFGCSTQPKANDVKAGLYANAKRSVASSNLYDGGLSNMDQLPKELICNSAEHFDYFFKRDRADSAEALALFQKSYDNVKRILPEVCSSKQTYSEVFDLLTKNVACRDDGNLSAGLRKTKGWDECVKTYWQMWTNDLPNFALGYAVGFGRQ